ncbi:hypothetical protein LJR030_001514 [Rhizobium sp. LjRoot30]|uniref:hypothetical protein n=1 Tax=Rhizobium sp. LjRoot30 TaxID=3342320 RepID=UPI003ECD17D5
MTFSTATCGRIGWWRGASGTQWITSAFPIDQFYYEGPAVYLFAQHNGYGHCDAKYVGQTGDYDRRMSEHYRDKMFLARLLGANEVHVHLLATSEAERFRIETDLRRQLEPILNLQGKGSGLFGLAAAFRR